MYGITSNFTVVYDSCVLYPAGLRDFLMQLALTDLFRAKWTDEIHEEWIRNLLSSKQNITLEQLTRTRNLMNSHVRDCLVTGYEYLIPTLNLPDADDRHVLAAAIKTGAEVIVTSNLSDFPKEILEQYEIEAQHPDEFISDLIDLNPQAVVRAVEICQQRLKNPPMSMDEYLEILLRQKLTNSVSMLREIYKQI